MPAVHDHCVELPASDDIPNFRRIETSKRPQARVGGDIAKEAVPIPIKQRHVPIESHSKTRARLFGRCRLMAEEYLEVQLRGGGQGTEPRCLVLDGVAREDCYFPGSH